MSLALVTTPAIEDFLAKASNCQGAELPESQAHDGEVEWAVLKAAAAAIRATGEEVDLEEVCQGSSLALKAPRKREVTPEFRKECAPVQTLLEARRKAADQQAYDKLVEDVTGAEAKSKMHGEYLPTMKLQIGQGVHMAVTMGLGYALGSQFGGALSTTNPMMKPLGGVVGLIVALVFETVLFIVRANMSSEGGKKYMHLLDPKAAELAAQPATPAGEAFMTMPTPKLENGASKKNR